MKSERFKTELITNVSHDIKTPLTSIAVSYTHLDVYKRQVLSREKLLDRIWGYQFDGGTRTVDVHIKTLRQKLGTAGACIKTVRGVGYKAGE